MAIKENTMITDWLDEHGDPEVEAFIEKNLAITERVKDELEKRGWTQAAFAERMGKRPSEVSKWLSGMHNLTLKSLIKMGRTLEIDLLNPEPANTYHYVHLGAVRGEHDYSDKVAEYSQAAETETELETAV